MYIDNINIVPPARCGFEVVYLVGTQNGTPVSLHIWIIWKAKAGHQVWLNDQPHEVVQYGSIDFSDYKLHYKPSKNDQTTINLVGPGGSFWCTKVEFLTCTKERAGVKMVPWVLPDASWKNGWSTLIKYDQLMINSWYLYHLVPK
jgi:hypothetical protein